MKSKQIHDHLLFNAAVDEDLNPEKDGDEDLSL
jgi:hypothetical protein